MPRVVVFFMVICMLALSACAGQQVEVRPKGQMVIGGSVGG